MLHFLRFGNWLLVRFDILVEAISPTPTKQGKDKKEIRKLAFELRGYSFHLTGGLFFEFLIK